MELNQSSLLPFAAPAATYARILFGQSSAATAEEGRALRRCRIVSAAEPLTLTVPVAGGARALARGADPERLLLSPHGQWPRAFRAAIATAYSRTPFYAHIAPRLDLLLRLPEEDSELTLASFLRAADSLVRALLPDPTPLRDAPLSPLLADVCRETADGADTSLSILHHLFHLGPDAIFMLRGALDF